MSVDDAWSERSSEIGSIDEAASMSNSSFDCVGGPDGHASDDHSSRHSPAPVVNNSPDIHNTDVSDLKRSLRYPTRQVIIDVVVSASVPIQTTEHLLMLVRHKTRFSVYILSFLSATLSLSGSS